jgi:hypothetical protein
MELALKFTGCLPVAEDERVEEVAAITSRQLWVSTSRASIQRWRWVVDCLSAASSASQQVSTAVEQGRGSWRVEVVFRAPGRVAFLAHLDYWGLLAQTEDYCWLYIAGQWRRVACAGWKERITAAAQASETCWPTLERRTSSQRPQRYRREVSSPKTAPLLLLGTETGGLYRCDLPELSLTLLWRVQPDTAGLEPIRGIHYARAARANASGHSLLLVSTPSRLYFALDPFECGQKPSYSLDLDHFIEAKPVKAALEQESNQRWNSKSFGKHLGVLFGDLNWLSVSGVLHLRLNRSALADGTAHVLHDRSWVSLPESKAQDVFGVVELPTGYILVGTRVGSVVSDSFVEAAVRTKQDAADTVCKEPAVATEPMSSDHVHEFIEQDHKDAADTVCKEPAVATEPMSSDHVHEFIEERQNTAHLSQQTEKNLSPGHSLWNQQSSNRFNGIAEPEIDTIKPYDDATKWTKETAAAFAPENAEPKARIVQTNSAAAASTPEKCPCIYLETALHDQTLSLSTGFEHSIEEHNLALRTDAVEQQPRALEAKEHTDPIIGSVELYSLADGCILAYLPLRASRGVPLALLPACLLLTGKATWACRINKDLLDTMRLAQAGKRRFAEALASCQTTAEKELLFHQHARELLRSGESHEQVPAESRVTSYEVLQKQAAFYLAHCRSLRPADALRELVHEHSAGIAAVIAYTEHRLPIETDATTSTALEQLHQALETYRGGADADSFLAQPCILRCSPKETTQLLRLYRLAAPGSAFQAQLREQILDQVTQRTKVSGPCSGPISETSSSTRQLLRWGAMLLAEQGNEADLLQLIERHGNFIINDRALAGYLLWLTKHHDLWHVRIELLLCLDEKLEPNVGYREEALDVLFAHASEMADETSPVLETLLDRICTNDPTRWLRALHQAPALCSATVWRRAVLERRVLGLGEALTAQRPTLHEIPKECPLPADALSRLFADAERQLAEERVRADALALATERLELALQRLFDIRQRVEAEWPKQNSSSTTLETPASMTAWLTGPARALLPHWMTLSMDTQSSPVALSVSRGIKSSPGESRRSASSKSPVPYAIHGVAVQQLALPQVPPEDKHSSNREWLSSAWLESLNKPYE